MQIGAKLYSTNKMLLWLPKKHKERILKILYLAENGAKISRFITAFVKNCFHFLLDKELTYFQRSLKLLIYFEKTFNTNGTECFYTRRSQFYAQACFLTHCTFLMKQYFLTFKCRKNTIIFLRLYRYVLLVKFLWIV